MNITAKTIAILVAFIAFLGVGFIYFTGTVGAPTVPTTKEFTLKIVERKLIEGSSVLTVKEGDTVVLSIVSDEAEELHLHGYDRSIGLEPNILNSLTFVANMTGRFTFELEKNKTELGAIEVYP